MSATQLNGFMTLGVKGVIGALGPAFERDTGCMLAIEFSPSKILTRRILDGAVTDVVIGTREGIDDLSKAGKLAPGSETVLAHSRMGLAVRAGTPKPDIATPEALTRTLIAARCVVFSHPTQGGASGAHFLRALEKLGIADKVQPKSIHPPPGRFTAEYLVTGEADIAIQQVSELMGIEGAELVGPLPEEVQTVTTFVGGVHAGAASPDAAKALLAYLRSSAAATVIEEKGLEPA